MALTLKKQDLPAYKTQSALDTALQVVGWGLIAFGGALLVGAAAKALGLVGIAAFLFKGVGFLLGPIGMLFKVGIIVSLPAIYSFMVSTGQALWNFNWNATDAELEGQIQSSFEAFYGMTGAAAGTLMGWLVCGAVPGAISFAFNPAVAKVILANVSEEARSEVFGHLATIAQATHSTLIRAVVAKAFMSTRRWLKRPDSPFYGILRDKLGDGFTKWGDDAQPSFTFEEYTEKKVETIEDERLKNFTKEFIENFSESCIEAGYVVVNTMASQMASQKLLNDQMNRTEVVEITFDRSTLRTSPNPS